MATAAEVLAIHWLADDDCRLAELFGGETGDEIDKFERCSWQPGPGGVPVLDGVKGWVAGPVMDRVDVGDHVAFVISAEAGAAVDASGRRAGVPGRERPGPGHAP